MNTPRIPGEPPDADSEVGHALEHLKEAEHDLELAREAEHRAEEETRKAEHQVEEAIEDIEEAEHPHKHWVVVNGRRKEVEGNKLTYDQVVALAFNPPPSGPDVQITVQYTNGPEHKPTGTLVEGQSVKIRDGMVFDVTATNRS